MSILVSNYKNDTYVWVIISTMWSIYQFQLPTQPRDSSNSPTQNPPRKKQAKERLNRAARESELRKARQEEQRRMGGGGGGGQGVWGRKGYGGRGGRGGGGAGGYDRHELERRQKSEARKAKKRASKSLRRDDIHSPYGYTISSERAFFDHVKVRFWVRCWGLRRRGGWGGVVGDMD